MKCQRCTKAATTHITEIATEEQFEVMHLCEDCAQKYLAEPSKNGGKPASQHVEETDEAGPIALECPACGIKFVEFRNNGRLGCAHDYTEFRTELLPLLENIHGETRHVGKSPRRLPQTRKTQSELTELRKQLQSAVTKEDYEAAAQIRDLIRKLETA